MADAQHYVEDQNVGLLSEYQYRLRLACLDNGKENGLFRKTRVNRRRLGVGSNVKYNCAQVLAWPFEVSDRKSDARNLRNMLDAKKGRLAIIADNSGSIAFQFADQSVYQPSFDFQVAGLAINQHTMESALITYSGDIVALSADLATTRLVSSGSQLSRPVSIATSTASGDCYAVATDDCRTVLLDSRLPAHQSGVVCQSSACVDGIVQFSPSGMLLSTRSPQTQRAVMFDIRNNRKPVCQIADCVASQWMPNRIGNSTLTTVDAKTGRFVNHHCPSATNVSLFGTSVVEDNSTQVVDFCWDSRGKVLLSFNAHRDFQTFSKTTCSVVNVNGQLHSSKWSAIGSETDCVDFSIDRFNGDRVYVASSSEFLSVFDFVVAVKRRPPPPPPPSPFSNVLIKNTIIR